MMKHAVNPIDEGYVCTDVLAQNAAILSFFQGIQKTGQFGLLMWKNYLIRQRHFIATGFEITTPILLSLLLVAMRLYMPSSTSETQSLLVIPASQEPPWDPLQEYLCPDPQENRKPKPKTPIYYVESSSYASELMEKAISLLNKLCDQANYSAVSIPREDDIVIKALNVSSGTTLYAVVFDNLDPTATLPPPKIKYRIRITGMQVYTLYPHFKKRGPNTDDGGYASKSFLRLQAAIERSHIERLLGPNVTDMPKVLLKRFPYPEYTRNDNIGTLSQVIPSLLHISLCIISAIVVLRVVKEKNNRVKEMMRLVGMSDFHYWLSVFMSNFLLVTVICILIAIVFKVQFKRNAAVLDYCDGSVFFAFLLLYGSCVIVSSMALTPFFNKALLAVLFQVVIFFLLTYHVPNYFLRDRSPSVKLAASLLPNMGLAWSCDMISQYEITRVGVGWNNLFDYPNPEVKLSIGMIMVVMAASIPLYLIILWYFDAVWPWQEGIPKPFYFPLQKSYWFGHGTKSENALKEDAASKVRRNSFFEEEPSNLFAGISTRNLTKVFGRMAYAKTVVNEVCLNVYNDQITALLGHNGAGKTTTMNMIIGMFVPTSGTVRINGYDILRETKAARRSMGLCPQHDVLYNELTVSEHLAFFAGMKGCPNEKLKEQVNETLRLLNMENKRDELAKNLSGGMKRKLCLGIAFIGGSKVLILDEPTSGMDPEARRVVWDILLKIREDRTILLTTHSMEEADALGDRIAIMVEGEIKCCGSPGFLKRKFGTGYRLRIAKASNGCEVTQTSSLILKYLPASTMESDKGSELVYSLPGGTSQQYSALFEQLEKNKMKLGIAAFGVSITTMEDVFLMVTHTMSTGHTGEPSKGALGADSFTSELTTSPRLTGIGRIIQQFKGLLLKRAHYAKRQRIALILQTLIPCAVWTLILLVTLKKKDVGGLISSPRLDLDLDSLFGETTGFYVAESNTLADEYYVPLLQSKTKEVRKVDNATSYLLGIAERDMQEYLRKYITGGEFPPNGNFVISWYNAEPYHTTPIALSLMDTALLRMVTGNSSAGFEVANHPLPTKQEILVDIGVGHKMIYAFMFPLSMVFLSSPFITFPIHERVSKAKLLQLMCGLNSFVFWGASFLWDMVVHLFVCSLLMVILLAMDKARIFVSSTTNMVALSVLLVLYGWCSIPFAYLASFIFKRTAMGFTILLLFNLILGTLMATIMIIILDIIHISENFGLKIAVHIIRLLPIFSVTRGIGQIDSIGRTLSRCNNMDQIMLSFCAHKKLAIMGHVLPCCKELCKGEECAANSTPFSTSIYGCGYEMVSLFGGGILLFLLINLLHVNYMRFWYALRAIRFGKAVVSPPEDSDVAAERQRVEDLYLENRTGEEAMIVLNLMKKFSSLVAVNRLTFGIHKRECFGLLGVNGAGKTTTFKMLTGDLMLTDGNAYIDKYDLKTNLHKFQSHIGYCPQYDPLLDLLTGRETLYLFACLRGVAKKNVTLTVNHLIKMVDLEKHADKITKHYSGGNRRKLSLAVALIGAPTIVFLDEPTSGVDPGARHKIWSTLTEAQNIFDVSIILTSHSMEECEALCSRLAIMVNGQFCCIGGLQHLRAKFAQGYTIIAKLKKEMADDPKAVQQVKQYIGKEFPSASLKDVHQGLMHYHVPQTRWSHLFTKMEEAKNRFQLEDFIVTDTTLEQIFLMFARKQKTRAQTN